MSRSLILMALAISLPAALQAKPKILAPPPAVVTCGANFRCVKLRICLVPQSPCPEGQGLLQVVALPQRP